MDSHQFKVSNPHRIISDFLKELNVDFENNTKKIIPPQELDIYIPSKKLAIEINGVYWHSGLDRSYHLNKTKLCNSIGVELIHFWDHEINEKLDIVKSILRNRIGLSTTIYARNTEIKSVSFEDMVDFLNNNHIQGKRNSKINIGLFFNSELVSLMTFSKSIDKKYDFEMVRFCNKKNHNVVGGASKLFKHFMSISKNSKIVSFSDIRLFSGNLYSNLGFKLSHTSPPNYWYFRLNDQTLRSRQQFQKHKLKDLLPVFDDNISESENMKNNGWLKIYDCGNRVWVYDK